MVFSEPTIMPQKIKPKTPRPYLSHSQMQMVLTDPDRYVRVYLEKQEQETNEAMEFGSAVHKALEAGETEHENAMIAHALLYLPKYEKREVKIRAKVGGIPLYGIMDGYDPKQNVGGEVKTGRSEWNQRRVDRHGQLTFYSLIKPKIEDWRLHWLNTATGEIKTFETRRTNLDRLRFFGEVKEAWETIKKLTAEYYSL
jgi:hypothetical protein